MKNSCLLWDRPRKPLLMTAMLISMYLGDHRPPRIVIWKAATSPTAPRRRARHLAPITPPAGDQWCQAADVIGGDVNRAAIAAPPTSTCWPTSVTTMALPHWRTRSSMMRHGVNCRYPASSGLADRGTSLRPLT